MLPADGQPSQGGFPWSSVQGDWLDEDGATVTVNGSTLQCPGGMELELVQDGDDTLSFSLGGEHYRGCLSASRSCISWDDGTSWLRSGASAHSGSGEVASDVIASTAGPSAAPAAGSAAHGSAGSGTAATALEGGRAPGGAELPEDDVVRTRGEPFDRRYAIKLQRELLNRYSTDKFLQSLKSLEVLRGTDAARFARERQELLLSVQSKVLPRYGFDGDLKGVQRMMSEWGPFLQDPEFRQLTIEINDLLGIDMPPETWERSVENFRRLVATTQPRERQRAAPGVLGLCMAISGGHVMGGAAPRCPVITDGTTDFSAQMGSLPKGSIQAPRVKPWPPKRPRPFKLFIAGSWDNYDPDEMRWQEGCFIYPVMMREECLETFQLLIDGEWGKTIYPSIADATPFEAHSILGPDNEGNGMNWCMGKLEQTRPGMTFLIVAQLDVNGNVALVHWQPQTAS